MQPAGPQVRTWRFQLIGFWRSRSLECRKLEVASMSWPRAPEAATERASCAPGKYGISLEQRAKMPARSTAATMRSAAPSSKPKGFSPRRSLPASATSTMTSSCRLCGRAT